MFKNLRKKKKGFTLIELIIVIAIIAILAAVAVPRFGAVRKDANEKVDIANAKTLANAASSLMAEDELEPDTYEINSSDDDVEGVDSRNAIEKYLQNSPTPKSVDGNFSVIIDEDGGVTVTVGSGDDMQTFFPVTE